MKIGFSLQIALHFICLLVIMAPLLAGEELKCDIFVYDSIVTADLKLAGMFTSELVSSIREGYPLHLEIEAHLKKSYPLWIDPTLKKYQAQIHIEFQSFGARFKLYLLDFNHEITESSDKDFFRIVNEIDERMILASKHINNLEYDDHYYFSFTLKQRRLTAAELSRAGQWYLGMESSDSEQQPEASNLPEKAFEQVLDMTRMGPEKREFSTFTFKPGKLPIIKPR
jgi:hypothetical protein